MADKRMWVLLVDDDLATVRTLRQEIDWEGFGFAEAREAYNVHGAIRAVEDAEGPPDLIVCDIEMPMGSGLDLLRWVRGKGLESEFIFLTCHESFSYASEAIEYRAGSYIVKPFDAGKMEAAVEKALLNIRRRAYLAQYSQYGEYWLKSREERDEAFWRGVLFSRFSKEQLAAQLDERGLDEEDESWRVILVRLSRSLEPAGETDWDTASFWFSLKRLACEAVLDEFTLEHAVDYQDGPFYYAALLSQADADTLRKRGGMFIQFWADNFPGIRGKPLVCISRPSALPTLGERREALEKRMQAHLDSGEVLLEEEAEEAASPVQLPDSGELMQYLEQQDRSGILRYLRDYMGKLSKEGRMDRSALRLLHQDFLQLVYSYLQRHEVQAHTLYQDPVSQQLQQLADSSSFDMIKWASYVADTAFKCVSEVRQTGTVVSHAEAYIREHFREDISRDDVAAAVYVTSSYLSRIFRTETGMKITDFLTRCRIEEAKRLLRTTDRSVSDIAVDSGFESFSYFSTVFKKVVGVTPVQYRKE